MLDRAPSDKYDFDMGASRIDMVGRFAAMPVVAARPQGFGAYANVSRPRCRAGWRLDDGAGAMNDFVASVATFLLLCVSAGIGRYLHPRMPETYRSRETMEATQRVVGMLVTFAALVLGLLTASVKTTYDTAARDRHAYSLQLIQLDHCLRDYGPDAESARDDIKSYTAAVIASTWRNEAPAGGRALSGHQRHASGWRRAGTG